jgi:hypothetical protein
VESEGAEVIGWIPEMVTVLNSVPTQGPKYLWANVLVLGVRDAVMGPKKMRPIARRWLFSNENENKVGSVLWICENIDYRDIERVRAKVREWIQQTPRRKFRTI